MGFKQNQNLLKAQLFGFMLAVYFFAYFHRVGIPATIFNELQSEFLTSAGTITLIGSMFMFIYGALQLPVGLLLDRFGIALVFGAGGFLLSVGAILFPLAPSLGWLLLLRALIAVGASCIFLSLVKAIDRMFDGQNFTIILGALLFCGYAGGLMGTWPLEYATRYLGWRTPLLLAGLLCLLFYGLAVMGLRRQRDPTSFQAATLRGLPLQANIKSVLRRSIFINLAASINFSLYFLFQAMLGKKMLEDCCGLHSSAAAAVIFVMTLISMLGNSSAGWLSRLLGNRRKPILLAAALLSAFAAIQLVAASALGAGAFWFKMALLLFALASSAQAIFNSVAREVNRSDNIGAAVGLNNMVCYLMVALIMMLVGVVMDQFAASAIRTASAIVYPLSAYCLVGLICLTLTLGALWAAWRIPETRGQYIAGALKPAGSSAHI